MAQIMRLLTDGGLRGAALQRESAGRERQKAGDRTQETRLARPVGTCQRQRRAALSFEGDAGDDRAPAAVDRDVPSAEADGVLHGDP